MKRILTVLIALMLVLSCSFAMAEGTAAEGKTRYISARSGLNIRAAADLDAEVVATPDFNYAVKVIGEEGKWSHVIYESNGISYEGYCWTGYLSSHKIVVKYKAKAEEEPDDQGVEPYEPEEEPQPAQPSTNVKPIEVKPIEVKPIEMPAEARPII